MFGVAATGGRIERRAARRLSTWTRDYLRQVALADLGCAVVGVFMAAQVRFGSNVTAMYLGLSLALPVLWIAALWLAGAYDVRFIGTGSDEYRKVLNAGVSLTAAVAIFSYTVNLQLSRAYVVIALPSITVFDLFARFAMRKRLHARRMRGKCLHNVVAVGHELAVAALVTELGRDRYHGLTSWGPAWCGRASATRWSASRSTAGWTTSRPRSRPFDADTVAVTTCPEMDGVRLRSLAWELEKTGTDLCVSPALLDVAGPRTTIRPTAGLTLLHVDHPQLTGFRLVLKGLFDRCAAAAALVMLAPVMATLAAAVWLHDRGPALFTQLQGGQGRPRVPDVQVPHHGRGRRAAPARAAAPATITTACCSSCARTRGSPRWARSCGAGPWTSCRSCSTCSSATCRWSGPRPALPDEAAKYADHVRRRLVVKPGLTGLWQVNGRSDLSWEESVRLDLRYVENWSFALDLQILWKTISVMVRGSGAY